MKSYIITKKDSGYTLLFAVLIASLVLGVATFILGVAHKQYVLSSTARNSSYAFYAADSGIECMSKDYGTPDLYGTSTFSFNCAGQSPSFNFGGTQTPVWDSSHSTIIGYSWFATSTLGFATSTTAFNAGSTWGCAIVSINQYYSYNSVGPVYKLATTTIQSRGYNLCKASGGSPPTIFAPDASSPLTVERALQWSF